MKNNRPFYVFFAVFAVMFLGSLAINLLTDPTVYLAPVIGLLGMIWAWLRIKGHTHIAGIPIGRNDDPD